MDVPDYAVSVPSLSSAAADVASGPRLEIRQVPITHPSAQLLIEQVQEEYVVRYGGRDESPIDPDEFVEPRGAFFLAQVDGQPVATGAWRRRDGVPEAQGRPAAEIKRMYVVPSMQRRGVARAVLAHLEATARDAGVEVMVLETGSAQPEAIALYVSSGYEPIAGFGHYRDSPVNRCFAKWF